MIDRLPKPIFWNTRNRLTAAALAASITVGFSACEAQEEPPVTADSLANLIPGIETVECTDVYVERIRSRDVLVETDVDYNEMDINSKEGLSDYLLQNGVEIHSNPTVRNLSQVSTEGRSYLIASGDSGNPNQSIFRLSDNGTYNITSEVVLRTDTGDVHTIDACSQVVQLRLKD